MLGTNLGWKPHMLMGTLHEFFNALCGAWYGAWQGNCKGCDYDAIMMRFWHCPCAVHQWPLNGLEANKHLQNIYR